MKTRSIFEKLVSNDSATSAPGGDSHEFFAEQLESRILYSAAPAPAPDSSVALEATEAAGESAFESIDSFKDAAKENTEQPDAGSIDTILMLASFDEMPLDEPVRFDTIPVAFKRWEAPLEISENSHIEPQELTEAEIVSIDSYYFGKESRYEFNVDQGSQTSFDVSPEVENNRMAAFGERANIFGSDNLSQPTNVFGLGQIQHSLEDWVEFAA